MTKVLFYFSSHIQHSEGGGHHWCGQLSSTSSSSTSDAHGTPVCALTSSGRCWWNQLFVHIQIIYQVVWIKSLHSCEDPRDKTSWNVSDTLNHHSLKPNDLAALDDMNLVLRLLVCVCEDCTTKKRKNARTYKRYRSVLTSDRDRTKFASFANLKGLPTFLNPWISFLLFFFNSRNESFSFLQEILYYLSNILFLCLYTMGQHVVWAWRIKNAIFNEQWILSDTAMCGYVWCWIINKNLLKYEHITIVIFYMQNSELPITLHERERKRVTMREQDRKKTIVHPQIYCIERKESACGG